MRLDYNAQIIHKEDCVVVRANWDRDFQVSAETEEKAKEKFENKMESKGIQVHKQPNHSFQYTYV